MKLQYRKHFGKQIFLPYISMKFGKFGKIDKYDVIVISYMACLNFMVCMKLGNTMIPNNHTLDVYFANSQGLLPVTTSTLVNRYKRASKQTKQNKN